MRNNRDDLLVLSLSGFHLMDTFSIWNESGSCDSQWDLWNVFRSKGLVMYVRFRNSIILARI